MAIRTAGGIPAIVACIAAHPDSVDVAQNACRAMANLAVNADNKVVSMSVCTSVNARVHYHMHIVSPPLSPHRTYK